MDLEQFHKEADNEKATLVAFLNEIERDMPPGLPMAVARADAETWQQTDCLACANCCHVMVPVLTNADVMRIATHLRMKPADFKKRWLRPEGKTRQWAHKQQPCQFLQPDNTCAIYEVRPTSCAEFPHHTRSPFNEYSYTFKNNITNCPATYTFVRRLAELLHR